MADPLDDRFSRIHEPPFLARMLLDKEPGIFVVIVFVSPSPLHAKLEKLDPTNPRVTWMGGVIAAMEGDRERALLAVRKIEDAKIGPIGFNFIGFVYYGLGDLDSYFEYMNKALEAHAQIPAMLMYSPLLAKARADPRYPELVDKLRKQCGLTK